MKISKVILFLPVNLLLIVLTFFLIEGFSNTVLVLHNTVSFRPIAERFHTQYDPEIGWINEPNVLIRDMYGKGKRVKTNSQRFRNDRDFSIKVPDNKIRLVCSGDSFTFGYGVDNDYTWCHLLTKIDRRLETVNMGQGGYGIDQAYLWYKRNSRAIEHDVHLFAFITDDFNRIGIDNLLGYGKPVLEINNGLLTVKNVPVPKRSFYTPWFTHALQVLQEFSSSQLVSRLYKKFISWRMSDKGQEKPLYKNTAIALKVFDELVRINRNHGGILALVYLPTERDYLSNSSDSLRSLINTYAAREKIIYLDLIPEFRTLLPKQMQSMFIGRGDLAYRASAGHYTEEGNAYIARALYKNLLATPTLREKLRR
jgi:hypothetical protein